MWFRRKRSRCLVIAALVADSFAETQQAQTLAGVKNPPLKSNGKSCVGLGDRPRNAFPTASPEEKPTRSSAIGSLTTPPQLGGIGGLRLAVKRSSALVTTLTLSLDPEQLDALAEKVASRLASRLGAQGQPAEGWMDTREAVTYLGLPSAHALHKLTSERRIPFSQEKPGARCYFRRSDLDAWREGNLRGGW